MTELFFDFIYLFFNAALLGECGKTERVSAGEWVVGGVDAFLLLNKHGRDRLCKCANLIFKRTALSVGPMRTNRT